MSGLDELDDALAAAEAELAKARDALRDARAAQAGERLEALAKELARTQAETADVEKANARTQEKLDELEGEAETLRRRLARKAT